MQADTLIDPRLTGRLSSAAYRNLLSSICHPLYSPDFLPQILRWGTACRAPGKLVELSRIMTLPTSKIDYTV